jgi:hypothetical protein
MKWLQTWVLPLAMGCYLGAQTVPEDPVVKARQQRAQAQGVDEADLPPVPRALTEPPPLPPPEIHAKDLPHPRVAAVPARRRGKDKAGRRGRAVTAAAVTQTDDDTAEATPTRKAGRAARRSAGRATERAVATAPAKPTAKPSARPTTKSAERAAARSTAAAPKPKSAVRPAKRAGKRAKS